MGVNDLLEKARVAYRAELTVSKEVERARQRAAELAKAALPEDVRAYLHVEMRIGGGWKFILRIPRCHPVEVEFFRTAKGYRLARSFVLSLNGHRAHEKTDLYTAIGKANDDFESSDIGSHLA